MQRPQNQTSSPSPKMQRQSRPKVGKGGLHLRPIFLEQEKTVSKLASVSQLRRGQHPRKVMILILIFQPRPEPPLLLQSPLLPPSCPICTSAKCSRADDVQTPPLAQVFSQSCDAMGDSMKTTSTTCGRSPPFVSTSKWRLC